MRVKYWCFLTIFSLLFAISGVKAEEKSETLIVGELIYKEFHDPGYVYFQTKENKEIEAAFYYRFISFEQIEKWTAGEKFELVFDPKKGAGIHRIAEGAFFKVIFAPEDNPIELLEKACLETAMTTLDIAGCFHQSAGRWNGESDYLFHELSQSASEEVFMQLSETRKKWLAYETSMMDSFYTHGQEQGGTIMRIHSASLRRELARSFFHQTVRFFE